MKKLIELIKKLFGSSGSSDPSGSDQKGFTLIELLIVIAILGILAGGLLLAIDPAEKLRQGNDTRAINDVAQTANKIEQWAISSNGGTYPTGWGAPTTNPAGGPAAPGRPTSPNVNYAYNYYPSAIATNTFVVSLSNLQSKKYTVAPNNFPRFVYVSAQGKTCFMVAGVSSSATLCP